MSSSPRWGGRATVAIILFVALAGLTLPWFVQPYFHHFPDSSRYVLLAESLLRGEGFQFEGAPFTVQPPGFALLIAPVVALFGRDPSMLNLYGALWALACAALLLVYARPRIGLPAAFALGAVVWLNPGFQRLGQLVLSDVPSTALVLACLLVERWASRRPHLRRDALLGLAIAVATSVRDINILLVPAVVVARIFRRRGDTPIAATATRGRLLGTVVVVLIPLVPLVLWNLRTEQLRAPPPSVRTAAYSQWVAQWHVDPSDPSSPRVPLETVVQRVPTRLWQLASFVGHRTTGKLMRWNDQNVGELTVEVAVGAMALVCLLVGAYRHRGAGELFALGLVGVLSLFYSSSGRHALPVYLLAVLAVAEVSIAALGRWLRPALASWMVAGLLGLLAVHDLPAGAAEHHWFRRDLEQAYRHHQRIGRYLDDTLAPGAPVASDIGSILGLYVDREVYTLVHVFRHSGAQGAIELLEEKEVAAVVLPVDRFAKLFARLAARYGFEACTNWPPLAGAWFSDRAHWIFRLDGQPGDPERPCDLRWIDPRLIKACIDADDRLLSRRSIDSSEAFRAPDCLVAGPVEITGGEVLLEAGRMVVLVDSFSFDGEKLQIRTGSESATVPIDDALAEPLARPPP